MDPNNRPTGRKRNVTGKADPIHKKEQGLGTGPVGPGKPGNFVPKPEPIRETRPPVRRTAVRRGGGVSILGILVLLFIFGRGLFSCGGAPSYPAQTPTPYTASTPAPTPKPQSTPSSQGTGTQSTAAPANNYGIDPASFASSSAVTHTTDTNSASVDTAVSAEARDKRTSILGGGKDKVTVMIYMCGTDLESRSSMATRDLVEMTKARLSDNVRVIVYTGGCTRWNNSVVASDRNQIYEIKPGGLERLERDMGSQSMTNPATLTSFIKYCAKNFPANRNELILWDHGGGSVAGFGYDEKYQRSGSMTLEGINQALKDGGVTFDFVGFDACLMATLETALVLDRYADYLIASEETEPGIGWYYTNWLNKLSANPSMPTVEIGKNIVDDFVTACAQQTRGQSATLSVVDLAELAYSVPAPLKEFSQSVTSMIESDRYQQVSSARNGTREFARSTMIDQIDLIHFARNLSTSQGTKLARALSKAIKYNRTSADISDAYGLSIYFPYRKAYRVNEACNTYDAIGMDESYSDCIRAFASLEVSGQAGAGVGGYSIPSILTGGYTSSPAGSEELIYELIGAFLGSGYRPSFSLDRGLSQEQTARYIAQNSFDPTALVWTKNAYGQDVISLSEEQWSLVEGLDYNLLYDDGAGYINLGLDPVFEFDNEGNLVAPEGSYWLAINNKPVPFYHELTVGTGESMVVSGYVPALLNGQRVNILLRWYGSDESWEIAGLRQVYDDEVTLTVAKGVPALTDDLAEETASWVKEDETLFWQPGDKLEFVADYYTYSGSFEDSHVIGETTVSDDMLVSDVELDADNCRHSYRFTDIYQQHYWTPALIR